LSCQQATRAQMLVEETGCHRRDPELLLLQARLCFANNEPEHARDRLRQAIARFVELGIRMRDFEVQALEQQLQPE